jgi:hypothetical protein
MGDEGQKRTYGYAQLRYPLSREVAIVSTHAELLSWIWTEARKADPGVEAKKAVRHPWGETYYISLEFSADMWHHLPEDPAWWIYRKLCDQGWEPFQVGDSYSHWRKSFPS